MEKNREAIEKCISEYQPRKWKIYKFLFPPSFRDCLPKKEGVTVPGEDRLWEEQPKRRELSGENANLQVHISESEMARQEAERAEKMGYKISFLFLDWEFIAAGLEPDGWLFEGELAEDWGPHKEGALVIQYCLSLYADPPHKVFLIEER
jgi:hypothetical protein